MSFEEANSGGRHAVPATFGASQEIMAGEPGRHQRETVAKRMRGYMRDLAEKNKDAWRPS
jgi:hypothetical protein